MNSRLPHDIIQFLNHYEQVKLPSIQPKLNLSFYRNQSPGSPSKLNIKQLHTQLKGDYSQLEFKHDFIQWFFPIKDSNGVNGYAQKLYPEEVEGIIDSWESLSLLRESFEIMLDFYGLRLINFTTGQLGRKLPVVPAGSTSKEDKYEARYHNLMTSSHNYLRITRILKCLSELSLEHLNLPFLLYFLVEQNDPLHPTLNNLSLINSMDHYWKYCIRNEGERKFLGSLIELVRDGKAVWGQKEYESVLKEREEKGTLAGIDIGRFKKG